MDRSLTMDIVIHASPERVFKAWTDPSEFVAWWGDDELYRTTGFDRDLRPGGKWRAEGISSQGQPFAVEGEYLRVDPPNELAFTWTPDWDTIGATTVELQFLRVPEGTRVLLKHSGFPTEESQTSHNNGWQRVFGWLNQYLESQEVTP